MSLFHVGNLPDTRGQQRTEPPSPRALEAPKGLDAEVTGTVRASDHQNPWLACVGTHPHLTTKFEALGCPAVFSVPLNLAQEGHGATRLSRWVSIVSYAFGLIACLFYLNFRNQRG